MLKGLVQKCRNLVFPIHAYELPKVLPLFFLFFLISFIFNLLRPLKISLVVTASGTGADIIPFLKAWAILPGAFFFAYLYTKLSSKLSREYVFFIFLGIFLTTFFLFNLAYPYREILELTTIANYLETILPLGFKGLTSVIRHWDLSLFYVMSEMWGNIMLTVIAWGFVNEIVSIKEAKRFYAIFACGADSAGIFSGQYAKLIHIDTLNSFIPFGNNAWEQTLGLTMLSVLFIGIIIAALYRYVNIINHNKVHKIETLNNHINKITKEQSEEKPSIINSLTLLWRSKYLRYLALIVLCYNITFNLFDVLWVAQLKEAYHTKSDLNAYMNHLTFLTGILAASIALLLSGNVVRKFGWKNAAFITPIVFILTGIGFFSCLLFKNGSQFLINIMAFIGNPINNAIIFFGTMQYCLTRACKYTVFDTTKEMAFIPLSNNNKRQGKAVIDTLVSRSSKSGSAFIYQGLFLFLSQLILTTPYVATIIAVLVTIWLYSIHALHKNFKPAGGKSNNVIVDADDAPGGAAVEHHTLGAKAPCSSA